MFNEVDLKNASDEFIQQAIEELVQERERRTDMRKKDAMAQFKVAFENLLMEYGAIEFEDEYASCVFTRSLIPNTVYDIEEGKIFVEN